MIDEDIINCKKIRKDIFLTAYSGGSAHLASSFSIVEILYSLYMKSVLKVDSDDTNNCDKFILSKGHGALALYVILYLRGLLDVELLNSYLKVDGNLGGEPVLNTVGGISASTGSLGHGLSIGVGYAIAQKIDNLATNTYVLIGDGECQEGAIWEAVASARRYELDNLIVILDSNKLQKTEEVVNTMGVVNWDSKWKSYDWNVFEIDGHNVDIIVSTLQNIPQNGKPTIIIANTIKGKGVSIMENNVVWHYKMPKKKELNIILDELEIDMNELRR